jgi:hypothetical protein
MTILRFGVSVSGAGAFACQPCARPWPILRGLYKTSSYRIVLNVSNDPIQLAVVADPMIERFVLPESIPSPAQNLVGLPCCRALQPTSNLRQWNLGFQKHVDVIGHDHPSSQYIEAPCLLAVPEGISEQLRNTRILQPERPENGSIHVPVERHESSSRILARRCTGPTGKIPRKRTGQTPSHEQEGFWLPVRQSSTIEHSILAGGSACPTNPTKRVGRRLTVGNLTKC